MTRPWKKYAQKLYRYARKLNFEHRDAHRELDSLGVPRRWPQGTETASLGWRIAVLHEIWGKGAPHRYSWLQHFQQKQGEPAHMVHGSWAEGLERVVLCACGVKLRYPLIQEALLPEAERYA